MCPPATAAVIRGKKWWRLTPSKAARGEATAFEQPPRAAGAEVVAAELLFEQLVAMHDPHAAFYGRLGGIAATALAHRLKTTLRRRGHHFGHVVVFWPCDTSCSGELRWESMPM